MRLFTVFIALLLSNFAVAASLYTYTGNSYDSVSNWDQSSGTAGYDFYDTSMSVSGNFLLYTELTEGASDLVGMIGEYSFNDGNNVVTNANSNVVGFDVIADASGNILEWSLQVERILTTPGDMYNTPYDWFDLTISTTNYGGSEADSAYLWQCPPSSNICGIGPYEGSASVSNNSGAWIKTSAVPIPAAAWLFGSALAGLGWMRRKQAV
jgi:hypothetical protein